MDTTGLSRAARKAYVEYRGYDASRSTETHNGWGTLRSDIDPDFCDECERDLPKHYSSCKKGY